MTFLIRFQKGMIPQTVQETLMIAISCALQLSYNLTSFFSGSLCFSKPQQQGLLKNIERGAGSLNGNGSFEESPLWP